MDEWGKQLSFVGKINDVGAKTQIQNEVVRMKT